MEPLNATQRKIIEAIGSDLYTVKFCEEWKERRDNVFSNAPAALQGMAVSGFLAAVYAIEKKINAGEWPLFIG